MRPSSTNGVFPFADRAVPSCSWRRLASAVWAFTAMVKVQTSVGENLSLWCCPFSERICLALSLSLCSPVFILVERTAGPAIVDTGADVDSCVIPLVISSEVISLARESSAFRIFGTPYGTLERSRSCGRALWGKMSYPSFWVHTHRDPAMPSVHCLVAEAGPFILEGG